MMFTPTKNKRLKVVICKYSDRGTFYVCAAERPCVVMSILIMAHHTHTLMRLCDVCVWVGSSSQSFVMHVLLSMERRSSLVPHKHENEITGKWSNRIWTQRPSMHPHTHIKTLLNRDWAQSTDNMWTHILRMHCLHYPACTTFTFIRALRWVQHRTTSAPNFGGHTLYIALFLQNPNAFSVIICT